MKIVGNRLLLRPLEKPTRSAGGIHLLPNHSDDKMQWQVVQLGTKFKGEVKVGDYVLLSGYRGNLHEFDDGTILIGPEQIKQDLLAVWTTPAQNALAEGSTSPQ